MKFSAAFVFSLLAAGTGHGFSVGRRSGKPADLLQSRKSSQNIVTWDEHSLFIHGERVTIFSAEYHPFRLPVPTLYLDVFQKLKAMGINMVSFYIDWALLEGKPGEFRSEGIFDLEPFINAAQEAGIYLLARPGPYINAEVSGGGFPGWLQRVKGILRSNASDYLHSTDNYMKHVGPIIAKAQITNGGPIILYQPENEYTSAHGIPFPEDGYMHYVIDQAKDTGIVVPLINNDASAKGNFAPGSKPGPDMDIYGHDGYPLGFDCANPYTWPSGDLPTNYRALHEKQSPTTPYSLVEFQGGSFDPPGGWGFDQCYELLNHEFARVYNKNNFAASATIFSMYMTYGGTNWGNLGHGNGYTSYDYGSAIREDRYIDREKYSEIKLQGQFLKVSPGYTVSTPGNLSTTEYTTNPDIAVTPLTTEKSGGFYIARHSVYSSTDSTTYKLKLSGGLTVPQLGGSLTLSRRDSKVHVINYPVGDYTLAYSTAEVFTWKKFSDKTIVVLYGGPEELHEVSVKTSSAFKTVEGDGVKFSTKNAHTVFQWTTSTSRKVVQSKDLVIYLLDRNTAYNYWVPDLPGKGDRAAFGSSLLNPDSVIVAGPYLVRSASVTGSTLSLKADFNVSTTTVEIIGAPKGASKLELNGEKLGFTKSSLGTWVIKTNAHLPDVGTTDLSTLDWYSVDSLPEIGSSYDDSKWTVANHKTTNNSVMWPLRKDVSLYASDYGYNTGALVYRGHFTATGKESVFKVWAQGGPASSSSVWLGSKFLGSFTGYDAAVGHNSSYTLPNLTKGKKYVLTVVIDNTGLHENWTPGLEEMKEPRGIVDWSVESSSGTETPIKEWKLTGNLGGEDYEDKFRGPLNEGGFFFERQGYHLPSPPVSKFKSGSPLKGLDGAGVAFYTAKLHLNYPASEYDIPLSFDITNSTDTGAYRAFLYVNGFNFGRYSSNVGPQTNFPVPEGILNYKGDNWVGIGLWALEDEGAKLPTFKLSTRGPVRSSKQTVKFVDGTSYKHRPEAY